MYSRLFLLSLHHFSSLWSSKHVFFLSISLIFSRNPSTQRIAAKFRIASLHNSPTTQKQASISLCKYVERERGPGDRRRKDGRVAGEERRKPLHVNVCVRIVIQRCKEWCFKWFYWVLSGRDCLRKGRGRKEEAKAKQELWVAVEKGGKKRYPLSRKNIENCDIR